MSYTPTTHEVERIYIDSGYEETDERARQFRRWLATLRAEAFASVSVTDLGRALAVRENESYANGPVPVYYLDMARAALDHLEAR